MPATCDSQSATHTLLRAHALLTVAPTAAFFHHAHEPTGEWWERTKPLLTLRRVHPPTTIFGHSVRKFAHQADVLRLELLQQFGCAVRDVRTGDERAATHMLSPAPCVHAP